MDFTLMIQLSVLVKILNTINERLSNIGQLSRLSLQTDIIEFTLNFVELILLSKMKIVLIQINSNTNKTS